jgi:7-keto-8-aminopelargonate synthetase-like enzyme
LQVIKREPERIDRLWANTRYALGAFPALGFDIGEACTPIIPIYIRDNTKTFQMATRLLDQGIFVNPVTSPAVAQENSLIRFNLMATHTTEQIDTAIEKIYTIAKDLAIV